MKSHGKWTQRLHAVYYVSGAVYYCYHLLILGGVLSFVLAYFQRGTPVFPLSVVVGFILCGIGAAWWRRLRKQQLSSLNPHLRIEEMNIDYFLLSETECVYTRSLSVKAKSVVGHYTAKHFWTGNGKMEPFTVSGCDSVAIDDPLHEMDKICRVIFRTPLQRGERRTFCYRLHLSDAQNQIKPFLLHYADCKIGKIRLTVHFQGKQPTWYAGEILASIESGQALWCEEPPTRGSFSTIHLEWPEAQVGFTYRITWRY